MYLHTVFGYYNNSSKFSFQVAGLKAKVPGFFLEKKKFVIALAPTFINMDFNITSHICWYDNILSKFDFQVLGSRPRLIWLKYVLSCEI